MSGFTRPQIKKLVQKLDRAHVHSRDVEGRRLDYIEGWFAVSEANAIFGFAGWNREMVHFERVYESRAGEETGCAYLARMRVTVRAVGHCVVREGTGFGQARARIRGEAHERALKAAETDATKRALATFGNRFGLALYDKDQNGVTTGAKPCARPFESISAATAKSAAVSGKPRGGMDPDEATASGLAPIFVLRDADGEILASALSGEGFCTGLRQFIEAYERGDELAELRRNNADMLRLLRSERPALKSAKGEHFADILERLLAKKQNRQATLASMRPARFGVEQPTDLKRQEIPAPSRAHAPLDQAGNGLDQDRPAGANGADALLPSVSANGAGDGASTLKAGGHTGSELQTFAQTAPRAAAPPLVLGPHHDSAAPACAPEPLHHPSRIAAGMAIDKSQLALATTRRVRNKAHLLFVGSRPCLLCESVPCHAHHLTFAQPRGLSIKVSDEFTVPLCAVHHNALHGASNERAFWRQHDIDPLVAARQLWLATLGNQSHPSV